VILYPAIDILGGRAVRLRQGDYDQATVYEEDPLRAARAWIDGGARALHIVDLDGAREGRPRNLEHVERIAAAVDVPIQVGGGLRDAASIDALIAAGADRVVLGTAAVADVDVLDAALATHGARVLVSVDARQGNVTTRGWTEQTTIPAADAIARLQERGVRRFVYSSVSRDGMLSGPDLAEVRGIAAVVRGQFIYSGGIGRLDDLAALGGLRQVNLAGVIVGTALYERSFTIAAGQAALDGADAETGS